MNTAPQNISGGSVFPYTVAIAAGSVDPFNGKKMPADTEGRHLSRGISRLDLFAAVAMHAIVNGRVGNDPRNYDPEAVAMHAAHHARALLAALDEPPAAATVAKPPVPEPTSPAAAEPQAAAR